MAMVSESVSILPQHTPLQFFHLSDKAIAAKLALKKKLKAELALVRFATENIEAECERRLAQKDSLRILGNGCSGNTRASSGLKRRAIEMNIQHKVTEKSEAASVVTGACKGDTMRRLGMQKEKGEIMDVNKMEQCANILKKLMTHQDGWVFNQPVDPVQLDIPDYFSIISKPMDLGTIKHKLEKKLYAGTLQFAADVRLTFSNARHYNPPGNDVHIMATELNKFFNLRWKSLETKWRKESSATLHQPMMRKTDNTSKRVLQGTNAYSSNSLPKVSLTSADKREMHQIVKTCDYSTTVISSCAPGSVMSLCKGMGGGKRLRYDCGNGKAFKTRPSGCFHQNDFTQASSNVVNSERSRARESDTHDLDCTKSTLGVQRGNSNPVDDDNAQPESHPATPSSSSRKGIDGAPYEEKPSPTKTFRAEKLKRRFADIIMKARQKTLLTHGEKGDPAKMQRLKEKLEKKQQEEKARIEAEVKAGARMKAEAELKRRRDMDREAARLAIQKMEKTVEIYENITILKDLEILGCSQAAQQLGLFMYGNEVQAGLGNPLEQLGLFLKKDDMDEEADDWYSTASHGDLEEGEICSW